MAHADGEFENMQDGAKLDRAAFSVTKLGTHDRTDLEFWLRRSPAERIAAVETPRRAMYGNDVTNQRLQRILEVVELRRS
jgi:hypothetical protein